MGYFIRRDPTDSELKKAEVELEAARQRRKKAEQVTSALEKDKVENGYAVMVLHALGSARK